MSFTDTISIYTSVLSVINTYLLVAGIGIVTALAMIYIIYYFVKKLISRV